MGRSTIWFVLEVFRLTTEHAHYYFVNLPFGTSEVAVWIAVCSYRHQRSFTDRQEHSNPLIQLLLVFSGWLGLAVVVGVPMMLMDRAKSSFTSHKNLFCAKENTCYLLSSNFHDHQSFSQNKQPDHTLITATTNTMTIPAFITIPVPTDTSLPQDQFQKQKSTRRLPMNLPRAPTAERWQESSSSLSTKSKQSDSSRNLPARPKRVSSGNGDDMLERMKPRRSSAPTEIIETKMDSHIGATPPKYPRRRLSLQCSGAIAAWIFRNTSTRFRWWKTPAWRDCAE